MLESFEQVNLARYLYLGVGLLVFYVAVSSIYTIWFHPLSKFPGPKRAVVSNVSKYNKSFRT
jgi:hypothetical protein